MAQRGTKEIPMKDWNILSKGYICPMLAHRCRDGTCGIDGMGWLGAIDENGWYCSVCKERAPQEIADVANLSRCIPFTSDFGDEE